MEFTHIYCMGCEDVTPVVTDELTIQPDSRYYQAIDLVCKMCNGVIVTVYSEKVGK